MDILPSDIKLYDIALDLDLPDLRHLCLTNRNMRHVCNSDNFWQQKTLHDFGHIRNINNDSWRSIYIQEYTRPSEDRCFKEQLDYNDKVKNVAQKIRVLNDNDAIVLTARLSQLLSRYGTGVGMEEKNLPYIFPVTVRNSLGYYDKIDGRLYTVKLFKTWWYKYIAVNNLQRHGRIYVDWLMRKVFRSKLYMSAPQKIRKFFITKLYSLPLMEFDKLYSIPLTQFDTILNNAILELSPINKIDITPEMARAICAERKRLTGYW